LGAEATAADIEESGRRPALGRAFADNTLTAFAAEDKGRLDYAGKDRNCFGFIQ
jgi:hypothetical protein